MTLNKLYRHKKRFVEKEKRLINGYLNQCDFK